MTSFISSVETEKQTSSIQSSAPSVSVALSFDGCGPPDTEDPVTSAASAGAFIGGLRTVRSCAVVFKIALMASGRGQQRPWRAKEDDAGQRQLLRLLLRMVLAGTSVGGMAAANAIAWPAVPEVVDAAVRLRQVTVVAGNQEALNPLWARAGTCTTAVKALAVALRRAGRAVMGVEGEEEEQVPDAHERLAYMRLAAELAYSFLQVAFQQLELSGAARHATGRLVLDSASAIIRSQALQCLARSMARELTGTATEAPEGSAAVAAAAAGHDAAHAAAAGGSTQQLRQHQQKHPGQGASAADQILFRQLCKAQFACASFLVRALAMAIDQGREVDTDIDQCLMRLLAALGESALLEHTAQLARHLGGAHSSWDDWGEADVGQTLNLGLCWLVTNTERPRARDHGLCSPGLHFLLTAAVVELLHRSDGGPRYGLPEAASEAARRLLMPDDGRSPHEQFDAMAWQYVLFSWTWLLAPGAGFPAGLLVRPSDVTALCMRVSGICLRAARQGGRLEAGRARADAGDDDVASSSSRGARSGGGSDWPPVRGRVQDVVCCNLAVSALVAAHDALERRLRGRSPAQVPARQQEPQEPQQHPEEQQAASPRLRPQLVSAATSSGSIAPSSSSCAPPTAAEGTGRAPIQATQPKLLLRVRPDEWWRAGVEALRATAALEPPDGRGVYMETASFNECQRVFAFPDLWDDVALLLRCQLAQGQVAMELPGLLPPSPSPDVAAALSAGYLPALERLLRRQGAELLYAPAALHQFLTWPALGWLLAYGDVSQAAALVVTVGKLLHRSASDLVDPTRGGGKDQPKARATGPSWPPDALDQHARLSLAAMRALTGGLDWARERHEAEQQLARGAAGGDAEQQSDGGGGRGEAASVKEGNEGGGSSVRSRPGRSEDGGRAAASSGRQLLQLLSLTVTRWVPVLTQTNQHLCTERVWSKRTGRAPDGGCLRAGLIGAAAAAVRSHGHRRV